MTLDANIIEYPAPAEPALDPRIAMAEMWLCMLGGLVRLANRYYRFLVRELTPYPHGPKGPIFALPLFGDPIGAFKRVVRALRFAAGLSLKINAEIAALRAGLPLGPHAWLSARRRAGAVGRADPGAAADDDQRLEKLARAESLRDDATPPGVASFGEPGKPSEEERFQALLKGSLKNAIAAICAELGLRPDWRLWTGNGFPVPSAGEVEDWAAFFEPGPIVPPVTAREGPCDRLDPPYAPTLLDLLAAKVIEPRPPPDGYSSWPAP